MTTTTTTNRMRKAWQSGGVPLGSFVFSRASSTVEIIGRAGYDFVIIDMEHAPIEIGEAESHIRAANATGMTPLVRVPEVDHSLIGRLLDLGAEGIMLAHYGRDRAASREFASLLRYAPEGIRPSCTVVRAAGYATGSYAEYVKSANANLMGIALVEDFSVIADLDEIFAEAKVDAVMPGPGDLSTDMGYPGQPAHPKVKEAIAKVIAAARRAKLPVGMYLNAPAEVKDWPGMDFYVYMVDVKVLALGYADAARVIRGAATPSAKAAAA